MGMCGYYDRCLNGKKGAGGSRPGKKSAPRSKPYQLQPRGSNIGIAQHLISKFFPKMFSRKMVKRAQEKP